jgi:hypothetical protein
VSVSTMSTQTSYSLPCSSTEQSRSLSGFTDRISIHRLSYRLHSNQVKLSNWEHLYTKRAQGSTSLPESPYCFEDVIMTLSTTNCLQLCALVSRIALSLLILRWAPSVCSTSSAWLSYMSLCFLQWVML